MIKAQCLDANGDVLTHLTQWDFGQQARVKLEDITLFSAPEVHFTNKNRNTALVVNSTLSNSIVTADIPTEILREPYNIYCYIFVNTNNAQGKTIVFVEIPIRKRAKPEGYVYSDDIEIIRVEELCQDIADAEATRVTNENNRLSNENQRISNESQRQLSSASAIQACVDQTSACNTATEAALAAKAIVDSMLYDIDGGNAYTNPSYMFQIDGGNSDENSGTIGE